MLHRVIMTWGVTTKNEFIVQRGVWGSLREVLTYMREPVTLSLC